MSTTPCTEPPHGYGLASTDWSTSFEAGEPPVVEGVTGALTVQVGDGPRHVPAGRARVGLTGTRALRVMADGRALARTQGARHVLADGLDLPLGPDSELRWAVAPVLDAALTYASTWAAVDVQLDDGTWLSAHAPLDQHGLPADPAGQGRARILVPDGWNVVRVSLGALTGRRVRAIAVALAAEGSVTDATSAPAVNVTAAPAANVTAAPAANATVWFDDIAIGRPEPRVAASPVDHVDTRRGSHSTAHYSRGNTVPAAATPHGAALWVPLTDGASGSWLYSWAAHNGPDNRPRLHGVAVSHLPSPWMGDRNQLALHPVAARRPLEVPDATLTARALPFDHTDEIARPHHYGVALDGGLRVDVAPTAHGAVLRFSYPAGATHGHVVLDAVSPAGGTDPRGPVSVHVDPRSGELTGWSDHGSGLSVGRSRMFVAGLLSRPVVAAGAARGDRPHARYAAVTLDADAVLEVRVATSLVSLDQARRTLAHELTGRTFAEVEADARSQWDDRLGVVEVEGATPEQLATLYTALYRLHLYPTSGWELDGDRPVHASPVLSHTGSATVLDGEIYVNHGFWDTYRTCWPAFALLDPAHAARLADGFVQQYREAGWIARWSSPGYADLMTGTSSDVAFAGLASRGVTLRDPLATYDAALRNATTLPDRPGVGRKGQGHALLHGWVPSDVHESVSWTLEGCINDAGIAAFARALADDDGLPIDPHRRRALRDDAAYLAQRSAAYRHLFDAETGFFRGRTRAGTWSTARLDPTRWGGDYTESDAWNFAYHAPHDPAGLARLHGGREALAGHLERFFATPERADNPGGYGTPIHEMLEARDVRLGQLGQSNQVSHHIPYLWLAAGRPDRTQEVVADIMRRLWTGAEIGQGFHGDEDNGELSAWFVLSALGLYPLDAGSSRWVIGTPLFRRAVVHRPGGDLIIEADGIEPGRRGPYVHALTVDGVAHREPWIEHRDLAGPTTLRFTLSTEPSGWGTGGLGVPSPDGPWADASATGRWADADNTPVPALADDDVTTAVDLLPGTLTWTAPAPTDHLLRAVTLLSAADGRRAPASWTLDVRDDDGAWVRVDQRDGETFAWAGQLRPFVLPRPVPLRDVRLTFTDAGTLAQAELLVSPAPPSGQA
jgi:predicted alpha-1,2-mannosidase